MYILHRVAQFVGGQYTGETHPQKVNGPYNPRLIHIDPISPIYMTDTFYLPPTLDESII